MHCRVFHEKLLESPITWYQLLFDRFNVARRLTAVLLLQVILGAGYGTPVDMWSLGCIMAELVTGRALFAGDDEADQLVTQLEYLGMPPASLLSRSKRAAQFFSQTTGHPRYCSIVSATPGGNTAASGEAPPPQLTGSANRSGTVRGPPGSKDLEAKLIKAIGRDPNNGGHRRHKVGVAVEVVGYI